MSRSIPPLADPATAANVARNARAERDRRRRWQPARDALWAVLEPLAGGARVAVVGAGNADDLPLGRLAASAAAVTLIDLDPDAPRSARRRAERSLRRRIELVEHDMTTGAADAIARAAIAGQPVPPWFVDPTPLPGAPYDLVVGDLFYSQLLYPALLDAGAGDALSATVGPPLTRAVVARLHASAPAVLHVHDPLAWWAGHPQPVTLAQVLTAPAREAQRLIAQGRGPQAWDPRAALAALGLPITATALWRWPFAPGVDYLACATLSHG